MTMHPLPLCRSGALQLLPASKLDIDRVDFVTLNQSDTRPATVPLGKSSLASVPDPATDWRIICSGRVRATNSLTANMQSGSGVVAGSPGSGTARARHSPATWQFPCIPMYVDLDRRRTFMLVSFLLLLSSLPSPLSLS